ncbi:concanavalin A-like lectin/glucanase domain-containing protein [Gautieria morchelliformis]|nr:concanavalin A-like lectin/glucanase domain-containing protein [Gautieria morchelliformis]
MLPRTFALAWCLTIITGIRGYDLVREFSGSSFFDRWTYYGLFDNLTQGDVIYVDRNTAFANNLTYITPQNTVIIKVDNFTTVPFNDKRNSVRITSNDFYDLGSIWIFDAIHLPFGCSVWPAWWTKGPLWPNDGEIDIIENINLATKNQMALHTTPGCNRTSDPNQSGTAGINNADCSPGSGCVIGDPDPRSWGQSFAAAGGGVWATQFDVQGIFIWFWSRADVPSNLSPTAPATPLDVSTWGPPTASYLGSTCNISQFFTPQQLVLNIDLCGDWAGVPSIYQSTCASQAPNDPTNPVSSQNPRTPDCYADNVVGPGARFDDAYFEINHIRAYTTAATPVQTSTSTSTTSQPNIGAAGTQLPSSSNTGISDRHPPVAWIAFPLLVAAGPLLI